MLDELYSNAYIYTLPSDLEGMPLSLLEAMSYGNCCLVSDIPECAEVVEDKMNHFQEVIKENKEYIDKADYLTKSKKVQFILRMAKFQSTVELLISVVLSGIAYFIVLIALKNENVLKLMKKFLKIKA